MKQKKMQQGYISPEIDCIGLMPVSVLCQSGESNTSLEDMTETDYTFTF